MSDTRLTNSRRIRQQLRAIEGDCKDMREQLAATGDLPIVSVEDLCADLREAVAAIEKLLAREAERRMAAEATCLHGKRLSEVCMDCRRMATGEAADRAKEIDSERERALPYVSAVDPLYVSAPACDSVLMAGGSDTRPAQEYPCQLAAGHLGAHKHKHRMWN